MININCIHNENVINKVKSGDIFSCKYKYDSRKSIHNIISLISLKNLVIYFSLFFNLIIQGNAQQREEYLVKTAYIQKITSFISWPEGSNINSSDKIVIGVAGENPFGNKLNEFYKDNTILDKPVDVISITAPSDVKKCHILFLSSSLSKELADYLYETALHDIISIGDTQGYAERGVFFNLMLAGNKIKLQVNYEAMKRNGFKVRSLLLQYAELVGDS